MVQNFAAFQQFSRIGSGGNTSHRGPEVPRSEVSCAICAQKDFVEHRYKLKLFREPPDAVAHKLHQGDSVLSGGESDGEAGTALLSLSNPASHRTLLQHRGVYYLQSPEAVHQILDVERYSKRWPLIPPAELHASSVQHPSHSDWRWLLHSRRVPVLPPQDLAAMYAAQPSDGRPPCAGIGDEQRCVFACWDCLIDLAGKQPKMPINACVNDNWIGRERSHVRAASQATKMLASLANPLRPRRRSGCAGEGLRRQHDLLC